MVAHQSGGLIKPGFIFINTHRSEAWSKRANYTSDLQFITNRYACASVIIHRKGSEVIGERPSGRRTDGTENEHHHYHYRVAAVIVRRPKNKLQCVKLNLMRIAWPPTINSLTHKRS